MNAFHKYGRLDKFKQLAPLFVVVLLVAGLGIYKLTASHAATATTSIEAELGTQASGASTVNDATASAGKAVKFNPASSGQSCASPSYTIPMSSSNPQNGVSIGNFYVTNDTWNAASYPLTQTLYVCSASNWYAIANMNNNTNNGAVKTYPNVHEDFPSEPMISSFSNITSDFAESGPHVGIYEYAYDMWLNGVATSGSTEVMIWNDNFNQTPGGSKQSGTFSDSGQTYNIYKSGSYIAFVDTTNVTSGTANILNFYNYIISKGWIPATSTIGQIDYGIELVSTNSTPATFAVTNFSLTTN